LKLGDVAAGALRHATRAVGNRLLAIEHARGEGARTVRFALTRPASVAIAVHDAGGRLVETILDNVHYGQGTHGTQWTPACAGSGVYWIRMSAGGETATQKYAIIR
jgi:hypothetical protein